MAWGWAKIAVGAALIGLSFVPGLQPLAIPGLKLTFGTLAISLGTSLAIGGITAGLIKPQDATLLNNPGGRLLSVRQPAAPRRIIYGFTRVGCVATFAHASGLVSHPTDQNQWVFTLSGHPIDSFQLIQFDELAPDIDMTTGLGLGPYTNKLFFQPQLGYDGDLGFASVMVGATPWTAEHRQRGCAAALIRINFDERIFPGGVPNVTFHVRGKPVFDPRINSPITITGASNATPIVITATGHGLAGGELVRITGVLGNANANGNWGVDLIDANTFSLQGSNGNAAYTSGGQIFELTWTNNTALITADYIVDPWVGMGDSWETIIEDVLIAGANVCDEAVDNDDSPSTTENRYTFNGTFETSEKHGDILKQMANAMAGHVYEVGGKWHIIPGAFRLPVMELTDRDVVAPMEVQRWRTKRDLVNGVKGTYPSAAHGWVETDFPAVTNATYLTEDGGFRVWKDIFLPFTITSAGAQRIAKIDLNRNRRQISVSMQCSMRAYELQPGDVVEFTHSRYSWALETFEVEEVGLDQNQDGAMVISLHLVQTDVDVYGFAVDDYGNLIDPDLLDLLNRKIPFGWSPQMAPGQVQTATITPLHAASDYSFNIAQQYQIGADNSLTAQLRIGGLLPVNLFSQLITRPRSKTLTALTATTGGFIIGGQRYYIAVSAVDQVTSGSPPTYDPGRLTALSEIQAVDVPITTDTNTVTLTGLRWHSGTTGWFVYFGTDPHRLSSQSGAYFVGSLGPQVTVTGPEVQPTSITFIGLNVAGYFPKGYYEHLLGAPDHRFHHLRIKATRSIHSGIWGGKVLSTTATTVTVNVDPLFPFTTNALAGRFISLMGWRDSGFSHFVGGGQPMADFLIASNTADTLTLEAGQDDPALHGYVLDAVVVIRTKVTAVGSDATGNYVEDTGFGTGGQALGDADPNIGGGDGSLEGKILRGIFGDGMGETRTIVGNIVSTKLIYLEDDNPFSVDSIVVVIDPFPSLVYDTGPLESAYENTSTDLRVDAVNLSGEQYFVEAVSVSVDGRESPTESNPYREIYLYGDADNGITVTADTKLTLLQRYVRVDTTAGDLTITALPPTVLPGLEVKIENVGTGGNTATVIVEGGALIAGEASQVLADGETILIKAHKD